MTAGPPAGLDPFEIFDAEAARLDRFFASLDEEGWRKPSRNSGWSVRDVLGHLAGEELYNHACLDDDLDGFLAAVGGVGGGVDGFNEWCVRERRSRPVGEVLAEWREKNARTRRRMRALGRDAPLPTLAGPYPAGRQALHYSSEYATHADDVAAPVTADEAAGRTGWRVLVGLLALAERDAPVSVATTVPDRRLRVRAAEDEANLTPAQFVEATVGRLPDDRPLITALRCLA
ncbi:hypothetical protein DPM19_09465 [Actinomadura craniellae]|uniref:Mycothiol-dependent maleylpyruvate isomerase metal-binding domain-containing protein n=1 Tax=Actinomadura craniellae TaxID=2231787 RepID=A0A365H9Z0_9ACTN|nr:maleylpyruvate isomerase family mycothiol-dependent enzyme [Actinomadura craniellae]RAY15964.1 hypothetical protein DPM19_09465 [Actinomadura craniellae]